MHALGQDPETDRRNRAIATYDGYVFDVPPPSSHAQENDADRIRSSPLLAPGRHSSASSHQNHRRAPRRQGSSATLGGERQEVLEQHDGRSISSMSVGHPYASARRSNGGRGRGKNSRANASSAFGAYALDHSEQ